MADPNLMGTHPHELDGYTPAELEAFLRYVDSKREALERRAAG